MNTVRRKKVAFHTLGCKLNFAETSTISRSFPEEQFERVPPGTKADIYVINTCSVTDTADRKCRQAIRKFINQSPEAFIAVVGCYPQLNPIQISSIPGVDLILGSNEKFDIAGYLSDLEKRGRSAIHSGALSPSDTFFPAFSLGDRTRSFLKIQDGCDYKCAYCTVPLARGGSRNPEIKSLVADAERIALQGVKEIVLTGVNIGDFGKSTGESFTDLLEKLVKIPGIERYRLSSIEPDLITDELIGLIAGNSRLMPHFHIPLQSGSDKILRLMKRRYNRNLFTDRVNMIKQMLPYAGIGADVIAGFPGESDSDFNETCRFLENTPLSYLHVFPYSERPGTEAVNLPGKVRQEEKERRCKKLISISGIKNHEFKILNSCRTADVLFENSRAGGMITGFTENYIKVEYAWKARLAGRIIKVLLKGISPSGKMSVELIN